MMTNADVTVYNKYIDSTTRSEKYQRSTVYGVVWQDTKGVTNSKSQLAANVALVMIPYTVANYAAYRTPKTWQALVSKSACWTLQEGDVLIKGIVADEITGGFTMTDLRAKYDNVVSIASIAAMSEGSQGSQHWEVDCK